MSKIHLLPQKLINLIAAGEVVERPSSALKEILENAIDAKATQITVTLEEYGNKLIEVADNGIGMNKEDAGLSLVQHATSKINSEDDLNNINTLGFRGEALASISEVAEKLIIDTKAEDALGVTIIKSDDSINIEKSNKSSRGTTVSVHNLYMNVPARKKFLKTPQTELKNLLSTFINIALPHTDIHFECYHDKKLIYRLTKTDNIKDRIFEIFGKDVAKNLYEVKGFESNLCKVDALIGTPEIAKKSSPTQYVFINGRFIINKTISSAVIEAYSGFIHRELKPTYFLFIHIDPSLIDVNIHPRKLEINIANPQEMFRTIYSIVRKTIERETKSIISNSITEQRESESAGNAYRLPNDNIYKSNSFINDIAKDSSGKSYKLGSKEIVPKSHMIKQALSFSEALIRPDSTETGSDRSPEDQNSYPLGNSWRMTQGQSLTQYFNTYIVYEKENELVFIDQHAAAEKITFEKLVLNLGSVQTKPLLIPEVIELNQHDKLSVLEKLEDLKKIGIIISDFGGNTIQVSEIPEALNNLNLKEYIEGAIDPDNQMDAMFNDYHNTYPNLTKEMYLLLATTACHGSIRAGQKLTTIEMESIVNNLNQLKNPYNCPHGRPVMFIMSRGELEKNFRRKI
jgi:DNA mismatch repair protein MutL